MRVFLLSLWSLTLPLFAAEETKSPIEFPDPQSYAERNFFAQVFTNQQSRWQNVNFLENVLGLLPAGRFDHLIAQNVTSESNDLQVYPIVKEKTPTITPLLAGATYAMPSLKRQKKVLSEQTKTLVGDVEVDGYLDIGSSGEYFKPLIGDSLAKGTLRFKGKSYLVSYNKPSLALTDTIKRGRAFLRSETFYSLNNYDPITEKIPEKSVSLVTMFIGLHHCPKEKLKTFVASIYRVLKEEGMFVLRDHDTSNDTLPLIHLAHSQFNIATGVSLEAESTEIRNFQSIDYWTVLLQEAGFVRDNKPGLTQDGDPTRNTLVLFRKKATTIASIKESLKAVPNYLRNASQSVLTIPEWYIVDTSHEYADFLSKSNPSYQFPRKKFIKQFWSVAQKAKKTSEEFNLGYRFMTNVLGVSMTLEYAFKGAWENVFVRKDSTDLRIITEAQEYAQFIEETPWYEYEYGERSQEFFKPYGLTGEGLSFAAEYLAKGIYAGAIKLGTKMTFGDAYTKIQLLVAETNEKRLSEIDDRITVLRTYENIGHSLIEVPRYLPFTDIIKKLARENIRIEEIAGNEAIAATVIAPTDFDFGTSVPGAVPLFKYRFITTPEKKRVAFRVNTKEFSAFIQFIQSDENLSLQHVYDY